MPVLQLVSLQVTHTSSWRAGLSPDTGPSPSVQLMQVQGPTLVVRQCQAGWPLCKLLPCPERSQHLCDNSPDG